jgi:hypothetical protein
MGSRHSKEANKTWDKSPICVTHLRHSCLLVCDFQDSFQAFEGMEGSYGSQRLETVVLLHPYAARECLINEI